MNELNGSVYRFAPPTLGGEGVASIIPYMRHVMYIAIDDFPPTRDACRPRKQIFRARIDALRGLVDLLSAVGLDLRTGILSIYPSRGNCAKRLIYSTTRPRPV